MGAHKFFHYSNSLGYKNQQYTANFHVLHCGLSMRLWRANNLLSWLELPSAWAVLGLACPRLGKTLAWATLGEGSPWLGMPSTWPALGLSCPWLGQILAWAALSLGCTMLGPALGLGLPRAWACPGLEPALGLGLPWAWACPGLGPALGIGLPSTWATLSFTCSQYSLFSLSHHFLYLFFSKPRSAR